MAQRRSIAGTPFDKTVRFTKIEIDGEEYALAFDFNAIALAESTAGINLLEKLNLAELNANQLRALFYAALLKGQPQMKLSDAGSLITLQSLSTITAAIGQAWMDSIGQRDASDDPREPEPIQAVG